MARKVDDVLAERRSLRANLVILYWLRPYSLFVAHSAADAKRPRTRRFDRTGGRAGPHGARGTDHAHAPPRAHMRHALHERTGDSALSATESRIHDAPGHPPPPPCARRAVLASVRSPFTSGVRRPLIRVTGGLFPFRAWAGWQGARAAGAGNPVGLVGVVVCVDFIPKSNTCRNS